MLEFLTDLTTVAPAVGCGSYAFVAPDGSCRGWVQFIIHSDRSLVIHRLWTLQPGKGNGSIMLRAVCDLADRHGIEMVLRTLPFGRKPYPMSRDQLQHWYKRHGFEVSGRKMVRRPRVGSAAVLAVGA